MNIPVAVEVGGGGGGVNAQGNSSEGWMWYCKKHVIIVCMYIFDHNGTYMCIYAFILVIL